MQPAPVGKILQESIKNQDTHLTLISNELKICEYCGDAQEFIREAIIVSGKEVSPPTKLNKLCYCQDKKRKDAEKEAEKEKQTALLMDKYKAADIPPRFLNWDFKRVDESENKKACQQYVDCFDLNILSGRGLLLIGSKGKGKSTLCYCMMKELIKKRYSARIVSFGKIIRELMSTNSEKSAKTFNQILEDLLKFDFTVLDDFGRETYTEKQLAVAFEFVNEMNKHMKCIAITANPENIEFLKSDKFAFHVQFKAILDRLDEMCKTTLIFEGDSFRRD